MTGAGLYKVLDVVLYVSVWCAPTWHLYIRCKRTECSFNDAKRNFQFQTYYIYKSTWYGLPKKGAQKIFSQNKYKYSCPEVLEMARKWSKINKSKLLKIN